jgi:hypothetical protein
MNKGQSLLEVVLAVGVSAVIIVVLVSLVNNAMKGAQFSRNQTLAARYAEGGTEWLRRQRDNDISSFFNRVTTTKSTWCLKDEPLQDGTTSWSEHTVCGSTDFLSGSDVGTTQFKREADLQKSTVSGKTLITATVRVYWTETNGTHQVNSTTQFTDWRER